MERIDEIGFGGLKLIQDTEMFCYGVDAVLLARFASRISHKKAADLGTNNGVIPILMSYMGGAEHITGAEMQERACRLAERNIEINGLKDRISICHTDILDITAHFSPGSFDCVVTNPPYTAAGTGVINGQDSSSRDYRFAERLYRKSGLAPFRPGIFLYDPPPGPHRRYL